MARRFSGTDTVVHVRILDCGGFRAATYRATVAVSGHNVYSTDVGAAASYRGPVDSPEEFDSVARAALSFANADGAIDSSDVDWGNDGPTVRRRK